jgi:hypothetical protein
MSLANNCGDPIQLDCTNSEKSSHWWLVGTNSIRRLWLVQQNQFNAFWFGKRRGNSSSTNSIYTLYRVQKHGIFNNQPIWQSVSCYWQEPVLRKVCIFKHIRFGKNVLSLFTTISKYLRWRKTVHDVPRRWPAIQSYPARKNKIGSSF